ncbi:ribokinase RbsK [soil metagenome]
MGSPGRKRTIVTSGFGTVDVVTGSTVRAFPGGTAINVAMALESLGWSTMFAGTVGNDPAGRFMRDQLDSAGVGTSALRLESAWTTPVILQESKGGDHDWRFSCPVCGAKFAKHRPAPEEIAIKLAERLDAPDVFFFDRATLFTVRLALEWSSRGTFVVFEPAGLGRPHLFDRSVAIADLIKYSAERGVGFMDRVPVGPAFIVETLGSAGARFRLPKRSAWHERPPYQTDGLVDTAGAGDWTSAGILDALIPDERTAKPFTLQQARIAIDAGQRLGAKSCSWQGVHPGGLRNIQESSFESFGCPRFLSTQ